MQKPLHVVQNQTGKDGVNRLIQMFGRYSEIKGIAANLAEREAKLQALTAAIKRDILPKIGSRDYAENVVTISTVQEELAEIRADLAKYATNIADLVHRDVIDLKIERDRLLAIRVDLAGRLRRTERNIAENRHISSKHFQGLVEFFPEMNQDRLAEVEEFHSGVAKALRTELRQAEQDLKERLASVDEGIADIDARMANTLKSINEPTHLVDRVYDLATTLGRAREENKQYQGEEELRRVILERKVELTTVKRNILSEIETHLNEGMRGIVTSVFGPERKSPQIALAENGYDFEVFEDTGTGTAYTGVLVFDLTIFGATMLPVLAHDSVMFKNIENDSVARLLQVYMATAKQSFIAIDEISKYGSEAADLLRTQGVLQLDDANVLYTKDWRRGRSTRT